MNILGGAKLVHSQSQEGEEANIHTLILQLRRHTGISARDGRLVTS